MQSLDSIGKLLEPLEMKDGVDRHVFANIEGQVEVLRKNRDRSVFSRLN